MIWTMSSHYADEVVVMEKGTVVFHDSIHLLFSDEEQMEKWHLDVPDARRFQIEFRESNRC